MHQIDQLFDKISLSVHKAAEHVSKIKRRRNKFKVIPGWNRNVKSLHHTARASFLNWIRSGRIRDSEEFRKMNDSRKNFKQALNRCKLNELQERSISIQQNYENKNMSDFWKNVKATSNKIKRSTLIDGKTNKFSIIDIFANKFFSDKNEKN